MQTDGKLIFYLQITVPSFFPQCPSFFLKCPHFFKYPGTLSPVMKFLGRTLRMALITQLPLQQRAMTAIINFSFIVLYMIETWFYVLPPVVYMFVDTWFLIIGQFSSNLVCICALVFGTPHWGLLWAITPDSD